MTNSLKTTLPWLTLHSPRLLGGPVGPPDLREDSEPFAKRGDEKKKKTWLYRHRQTRAVVVAAKDQHQVAKTGSNRQPRRFSRPHRALEPVHIKGSFWKENKRNGLLFSICSGFTFHITPLNTSPQNQRVSQFAKMCIKPHESALQRGKCMRNDIVFALYNFIVLEIYLAFTSRNKDKLFVLSI